VWCGCVVVVVWLRGGGVVAWLRGSGSNIPYNKKTSLKRSFCGGVVPFVVVWCGGGGCNIPS